MRAFCYCWKMQPKCQGSTLFVCRLQNTRLLTVSIPLHQSFLKMSLANFWTTTWLTVSFRNRKRKATEAENGRTNFKNDLTAEILILHYNFQLNLPLSLSLSLSLSQPYPHTLANYLYISFFISIIHWVLMSGVKKDPKALIIRWTREQFHRRSAGRAVSQNWDRLKDIKKFPRRTNNISNYGDWTHYLIPG